MSELRAKRDAQTRAELSSTAIGLFAQQGFVETTMADVAEAAGVSRRTAYRHYANKEDLLFEHPKRWLELFHEIVGRQGSASTKHACSAGVLAVAAEIVTTKEDVLAGYGVIAVTPSLQSRYARTNRDWLEAYTAVIGADISDDDQAALLQASVLAGALVGGTDRAVISWFLHPGSDLVELTQDVLDAVEDLWPDATL